MMDPAAVGSNDVSMEKIQNEDFLIEILVLLPPKSIFRFMCVSRRCRSIIAHPFFVQRYSAAAAARRRSGGCRLLAFFQRSTILDHCNTLPIPIPGGDMVKDIPRNLGYFINSSNGLILFGDEDSCIYHVVNPVTGKYVSLPPPPCPSLPDSTGIMCEENTTDLVPVYTVVRAGLPLCLDTADIIYIDTYSSRTGEWSNPIALTATDRIFLLRRPPVVANGIFHWYLTVSSIAVYDPNDGEDHLQLIQLPCFGSFDSYEISRSADDDLLWCGGISCNKRMKFFMLPKGEEDDRYKRKTCIYLHEWVLMYEIRLDSLYEDTKILTKRIVLESIISTRNSQIVAVLRHGEDVFLCNLESKKIEMVEYVGRYSEDFGNYLSPYVESCFLSTYAL